MPRIRIFQIMSKVEKAEKDAHGEDLEENEKEQGEEIVAKTFDGGVVLSFGGVEFLDFEGGEHGGEVQYSWDRTFNPNLRHTF
jgi:hypothetical protein